MRESNKYIAPHAHTHTLLPSKSDLQLTLKLESRFLNPNTHSAIHYLTELRPLSSHPNRIRSSIITFLRRMSLLMKLTFGHPHYLPLSHFKSFLGKYHQVQISSISRPYHSIPPFRHFNFYYSIIIRDICVHEEKRKKNEVKKNHQKEPENKKYFWLIIRR